MSSFRPVPTVRLWLRKIGVGVRGIRFGTPIRAAMARRRRVPVLRQLSEVECGAVCLAMVINYYGRKIRVSDLRELCGPGRDGITARGIANAARHYGLRVKGFSLEPPQFRHLSLPAIAHWDFSHFVVVERWSPNRVEIVDPAIGRRRLLAAEFDEHFTGVVLTLTPSGPMGRGRTASQPAWLSFLRHLLQIPKVRGVLVQILGASLFLQIFGLAVPLFTKILVDHVLPFRITNVMMILGLGMLTLVLAQMVTSYLRAALLIYLRARTDSQLMLGFFEHLLSLPYCFFQQRSTGDLMMRLASNEMLREVLTSQTLSAALDGTFVLAYLAILLAVSPLYGVLVLGIGMLQIALLVGVTRRVRALVERDLRTQAASQDYLVETLRGIATLKASGAEDRALDHWSNLFFDNLNVSMQRNQLSAIVDTAMTTLRTFSPLVLLWVGAIQVLAGAMSLGTMLALTALSLSFLTPLASLVGNGQRFQLIGAYLDRLMDVLEAEPEQELQSVRPAPPLTGRVELNHVSFRYDREAPLVLRDISLTIEPGQKVALVGRSGSGKSTLAMLLLGLYTPTEGEIVYDGVPLQRLEFRTLRSQFGAVLQESSLFSGSIRQNIAFNHPNVSLEAVTEAARLAAIHDEIVQMPMGYETRLAEGGAGLSGGQRQRLSIARAVAQTPVILMLDEATSHLDVLTEALVDSNLSHLTCTRVVIAHRLSTIRNADLILVLDEGEIVERGSHESLLAQSGRYASLVQTQQEGSETAEEETSRVTDETPYSRWLASPAGRRRRGWIS